MKKIYCLVTILLFMSVAGCRSRDNVENLPVDNQRVEKKVYSCDGWEEPSITEISQEHDRKYVMEKYSISSFVHPVINTDLGEGSKAGTMMVEGTGSITAPVKDETGGIMYTSMVMNVKISAYENLKIEGGQDITYTLYNAPGGLFREQQNMLFPECDASTLTGKSDEDIYMYLFFSHNGNVNVVKEVHEKIGDIILGIKLGTESDDQSEKFYKFNLSSPNSTYMWEIYEI